MCPSLAPFGVAGRARDRVAHGIGIEGSPARAHVLVRADEISRSRPPIVARAYEAGLVLDHDPVVARGTADLNDAAGDRILRKRLPGFAGNGVAEREQAESIPEIQEQPVAARTGHRGIR